MFTRHRKTLQAAGLGLIAGWQLLFAGVAFAAQRPPDQPDETAIAAMKALGRDNGTPTWHLGEYDVGAYCQLRYGVNEGGFDQASQSYYCKTKERWILIVPIEACRQQFPDATLADGKTLRCYRFGGADPGPAVSRQSGPIHVIKPGTVEQAFGDAGAQVVGEDTARITADQVAASGVADRTGGSGPLQAWNKLPLFARVMIFGGGTMIVGLWAGGWAIRMMP